MAAVAWAAPGTIIGLCLAPFFERRHVTLIGLGSEVMLCEGARWPRRVGWRYGAITFGHVVLSTRTMSPEVWRHELVHVRQWERWGPLFVPLYLLASLWAVLRRGHYYRDNAFEVAARGR